MNGFCRCGCGQRTETAMSTDRRVGRVKGQPRPYVEGHYNRLPDDHYAVVASGHATPCWVWRGATNAAGYGSRKDPRFKSALVHRQMYERHVGPIPAGAELDHLCRNPGCCNPDHLEPVTRDVNAWRGRGTKLTPDDVRAIRASRESDRALARRFGTTKGNIWNIRSRRQWKAVA